MKDSNDKLKIHLSLKFMFMSTKDTGEEWDMHLKSKNIAIMVGSVTTELIKIINSFRISR